MQIIRTYISFIGAFLMSFITKPLFGKYLSRYWQHVLNRVLGCCITVIIALNIHKLNEDLFFILLILTIIIFNIIIQISASTTKGREHLKLWYDEASDEDDKEYLSNRDMHGKGWWKFMYINGWITIIVLNLGGIIFLFPILPNSWRGGILLIIFGLIVTFIIIRDAKKRKRDYDNGYK